MAQRLDITGQRFGRLTAIEYVGHDKHKNAVWKCKCDCGKYTNVSTHSLKSGHTKSCGCLSIDSLIARSTTHGMSGKETGRIYPLWRSIRYRCKCETSQDYKDYGARGIKVCEEWDKDFTAFYKWAMSHGYKEEKTDKGVNILTIDRIDVNGNYEPDNCRFVTNAVQALNRRNNMTEEERYKNCPVCGAKFYTRRRKNGRKYCSKACYVIGRWGKTNNECELQAALR